MTGYLTQWTSNNKIINMVGHPRLETFGSSFLVRQQSSHLTEYTWLFYYGHRNTLPNPTTLPHIIWQRRINKLSLDGRCLAKPCESFKMSVEKRWRSLIYPDFLNNGVSTFDKKSLNLVNSDKIQRRPPPVSSINHWIRSTIFTVITRLKSDLEYAANWM